MVLQRTRAGNGYGFGGSGQEGNVSQDETDRSELEAEARVLPESELMSLISAAVEEQGDQTPQDDSEDAPS
jgi:hypothetical protein